MNLGLNERIKAVIAILIVVGIVLSLFFGLLVVLNTSVPFRVVKSGSMCIPYDSACDGWSHPFAQTLHAGDIIIVQGINPKDLNVNYPNSEIIVYNNPAKPDDTPIVHRIVLRYEVNGVLYFQTKGDGNGTPWPATVNPSEYDSNSGIILTGGEGVPANLVEGRVIMRIPWFGHVTLFLQRNPWGVPLIFLVIALLVVIEFVLPLVRKSMRSGSTLGIE